MENWEGIYGLMEDVSKKTPKEVREEKRREANRKAAAENMQKKQASIYDADGKVVTSYDKKLAKRKEEQKKDKRNTLITRITLIVVLVAVAAALIFAIGKKVNERYGTAVTVNGEKIGRVEYDFYYHMGINNFMNTYGSYASYFGLDTGSDLSKQIYRGDETWADYFGVNAVEMIKEMKALSAEADKNSFSYDDTDDYNEFNSSIEKAASDDGSSVKDYYKKTFGDYATQSSIESYVKQYLRANAYYDDYQKNLTFSDAEINDYYNENKDKYDVVDYRYLEVADLDKANEMLASITDGSSFRALCPQYAADDLKSGYETDDKSLATGATQSSITTGAEVTSWLFDSARKEGDKTVVTVADDNKNYVLYFGSRYLTDAQKSIMTDSMKSSKSQEYINSLIDGMTSQSGTVKIYEETAGSADGE